MDLWGTFKIQMIAPLHFKVHIQNFSLQVDTVVNIDI
jgi:hypothetical protein